MSSERLAERTHAVAGQNAALQLGGRLVLKEDLKDRPAVARSGQKIAELRKVRGKFFDCRYRR